jgi:hypothetical protein
MDKLNVNLKYVYYGLGVLLGLLLLWWLVRWHWSKTVGEGSVWQDLKSYVKGKPAYAQQNQKK